MSWFAVRCVFELDAGVYEERITIWQADSADDAHLLAELEADEYAESYGRFLGLSQSFEMFDSPQHGAEIFSLIRTSELDEDQYLTTFFSTGNERTRSLPDVGSDETDPHRP